MRYDDYELFSCTQFNFTQKECLEWKHYTQQKQQLKVDEQVQ